jgi:hypothetical protein
VIAPAPVAVHRSAPDRADERTVRVVRSRPIRIVIPAIGLSAPLDEVGLDRHGHLGTPSFARPFHAAWYDGGPVPGRPGAAIIVGHYDSYTGPAVFFHLDRLRRGDRIVIRLADGAAPAFIVRRTAAYAKTGFPTRLVYGPTRVPAIRLITCGGPFDFATRHYLDNLVVYAVRAPTGPHS